MHFFNLATWDRTLRILLGACLLVLGWSSELQELWPLALRIFGWVPLLTGLIGWSPLYSLLGISTRRSFHRLH